MHERSPGGSAIERTKRIHGWHANEDEDEERDEICLESRRESCGVSPRRAGARPRPPARLCEGHSKKIFFLLPFRAIPRRAFVPGRSPSRRSRARSGRATRLSHGSDSLSSRSMKKSRPHPRRIGCSARSSAGAASFGSTGLNGGSSAGETLRRQNPPRVTSQLRGEEERVDANRAPRGREREVVRAPSRAGCRPPPRRSRIASRPHAPPRSAGAARPTRARRRRETARGRRADSHRRQDEREHACDAHRPAVTEAREAGEHDERRESGQEESRSPSGLPVPRPPGRRREEKGERTTAAEASASRASRRRSARKPSGARRTIGAYQKRPLFGNSVRRRSPVKNGYENVSPA